jgi:co-chaperonin GroES (HSP10)
MERAGINLVKVKLDPENNEIIMKSGIKFFLDTSINQEQHTVLQGEVESLPLQLCYSDKGDKLPWLTDMEIQVGDRVLMYYMGVFNCLAQERRHYIKEGPNTWIFIKYQNIYAVIRNGQVIPINGYLLVEPEEDPEWIRITEQAAEQGLELPDMRKPTNTHVTYGKIAYMGKPNKFYFQPDLSDEMVDVEVGDSVVLKKVRDIPAEYEYHAKIDNGRKLYRVQRHDILAVL